LGSVYWGSKCDNHFTDECKSSLERRAVVRNSNDSYVRHHSTNPKGETMKYFLMGLGAYSVGIGWFFMEQNDSAVSWAIGSFLGLILIFGAVVLAIADLFKERK
jgi:hypothetical protein